MPNKDGTGPLGQGTGTGRLRGGCAAGRGNNKCNTPGKGLGRKNVGDNGSQNGGGANKRGFSTTNRVPNK